MDDNFDFIAVTSQRLVDRIIENFEYHVMQSGAIAGVTDIHAGPLADRLKAFEYLYAVGIVFR
jgi:hypothetical protein